MSSLRDHFEKTCAEKAVAQKNADPRLSARNRPIGNTMTRQTTPATDGIAVDDNESGENPDAIGNIGLKFFNDEAQLSGIQSISAKTELKSEFLPHYLPWIEGTIAGGTGPQNDMLVKLMVWALDTHDFETAIKIAEYALLNDFAMPEPFSRDVATVFVEQLSDEMLNNIDVPSEFISLVERAVELTTDQDMPDQVRAKLYRALGNSLAITKPTEAITAYERAIKLDDKVGCKKDLARLTKSSE